METPRIVVFVRSGSLLPSRKNNPWLSGPWCLTLVPTHLDLDHPPFIVYQLINCPIEDAEFHARFDYQRKRFFFSGCLDLYNDIVFFWYWLIPDKIELISCFLGQVGGEKPQQKNLGYTYINKHIKCTWHVHTKNSISTSEKYVDK